MSISYEERFETSYKAVKNLIRKIYRLLDGMGKHTNIDIPENIQDMIKMNAKTKLLQKIHELSKIFI